MKKPIIAKTPLEVKVWFEQNPNRFSAGWLTKEGKPVQRNDDWYYFAISAHNATIWIPPEVKERCFVTNSNEPGVLFEWDDKAERKAECAKTGAKEVTLAKRA